MGAPADTVSFVDFYRDLVGWAAALQEARLETFCEQYDSGLLNATAAWEYRTTAEVYAVVRERTLQLGRDRDLALGRYAVQALLPAEGRSYVPDNANVLFGRSFPGDVAWRAPTMGARFQRGPGAFSATARMEDTTVMATTRMARLLNPHPRMEVRFEEVSARIAGAAHLSVEEARDQDVLDTETALWTVLDLEIVPLPEEYEPNLGHICPRFEYQYEPSFPAVRVIAHGAEVYLAGRRIFRSNRTR